MVKNLLKEKLKKYHAEGKYYQQKRKIFELNN